MDKYRFMNNNKMQVRKRNGSTQPIYFDKIIERIKKLCSPEELEIMDIATEAKR